MNVLQILERHMKYTKCMDEYDRTIDGDNYDGFLKGWWCTLSPNHVYLKVIPIVLNGLISKLRL